MRVRDYLDWADGIFSHVSVENEVKHFLEEVDELVEAVENEDIEEIGKEMSDVIMLAMWLGHRFGLDPSDEFEKKFQINLKRKWQEDPDGCMRHVKS